jgi:hypothetical protein
MWFFCLIGFLDSLFLASKWVSSSIIYNSSSVTILWFISTFGMMEAQIGSENFWLSILRKKAPGRKFRAKS